MASTQRGFQRRARGGFFVGSQVAGLDAGAAVNHQQRCIQRDQHAVAHCIVTLRERAIDVVVNCLGVLQDGPDRAAADAALQALIDRRADSMAYQIAEVYAQRRDLDNAFKWLDRAWANRDPGVAYLLYDPYLLRLKDDPRFAAWAAGL